MVVVSMRAASEDKKNRLAIECVPRQQFTHCNICELLRARTPFAPKNVPYMAPTFTVSSIAVDLYYNLADVD